MSKKTLEYDKKLDELMNKGTYWLINSLMCFISIFLMIYVANFLFDSFLLKFILIGITILLFLFNWVLFAIYAHKSFVIRVQKEIHRLNRKDDWEKRYKDTD